jgi:hypothetical protein
MVKPLMTVIRAAVTQGVIPFSIRTSRKVQKFGHMGYDNRSTPPIGSYYLNLNVMLVLYFSLKYLKFI